MGTSLLLLDLGILIKFQEFELLGSENPPYPVPEVALFQGEMTNPGNVIRSTVHCRNNFNDRLHNSEIWVGNVTMIDRASNPSSNTLCMRQPDEDDVSPRIYDCARPLNGKYVILYKSKAFEMCQTDNCFDVIEIQIYLV